MAASFSLKSFIRNALLYPGEKHQTWLTAWRNFTASRTLYNEEAKDVDAEEPEATTPMRKVVDAETSIRYLNSTAYTKGYGDKPVWFHYRRNFKGHVPPPTRKSCIRKGEISTASPCPICRDEYLVLDAKNTKLLEQFISPHSGEIFDSMKTGVCQRQHKKLVLEVMKARDIGLLEMKLPFRSYDYNDYKS